MMKVKDYCNILFFPNKFLNCGVTVLKDMGANAEHIRLEYTCPYDYFIENYGDWELSEFFINCVDDLEDYTDITVFVKEGK